MVLSGCVRGLRIDKELVIHTWLGWCILVSLGREENKDIICDTEDIASLDIVEWVGREVDRDIVKGVKCYWTKVIIEYGSR